ncbi:DNA-binding protein [Bacteroides sp. 214]|uniref:HU family DNA-binding protein n=1 Tax=Bacteroides sp. 214 TaxID=2302935 RepID=UPI0013CFDCA5|nr:DNA-binding protein [Bacteroides sp. 214]NDW12532.1 DNA-binding protein [Bacteroides sp. 214]
MAIRYDFYEVNEVGENEQESKMRARTVSRGTITADKLFKWVAQTNGFSRAETKGVMAAIADGVLYYLSEGYSVELGDLGFLSVSLTSRKVKNSREIRAESIKFNKINFRASARMRKQFLHIETEKVTVKRPKSSNLSRAERAQRLKTFLETRPFATCADYCKITATLKGKAIIDINAFIEEGWLKKYGSGNRVVYLLYQK